MCDYRWYCNLCGQETGDGGCPEHAPSSVPGLQLVECEAHHPRTWLLADDGYPPPCPWCMAENASKAHEGCAHARHRRWRRWKATSRALSALYSLGVITGHRVTYDQYCRGCADGITLGRNRYLLGWPRWKWRCLLVARHWPGEEIIDGICGKCNPWTCCGSSRWEHNDGCPEATA